MKKDRNIVLILSILFFYINLYSQNTVGVISYEAEEVLEGYTLLYPLNQPNVYLIDNCGQVVHEWIDSSLYSPGNSVYLLDNGDLLKTKNSKIPSPGSFSSGGAGAIVELVSWDNELKWSKEIRNTTFRMHHDVEILPNGNVLIIVWQRRTREEYIQAGGDTTLFDRAEIWPDIIQEYDPILDSIVWVWDSWDHLVQDFDSTKENFGEVTEKIGKINLNYNLDGFGGRPDWIHSNSIDYNEELDQILICTPHFEEIWIIDHSTTPDEAKGNIGGQFGKGGQLLFRWGNPQTYDKGVSGDKKLFFQHDAQWLDDPSLVDSDYYQQIGLFNNRIGPNKSAINILTPWLDIDMNEYIKQSGIYLPSFFEESIESTQDLQFQSSNMSSMQLLANGNYVVCAAQRGTIIETTPQGKEIWKYVLPFRNGFRINQGSDLNIGDNVIFRAKKYDVNFPAFSDKELDPKYYLELDANTTFCNLNVNTIEPNTSEFSIYPIPTQDVLNIRSTENLIQNIEIYSSLGERVESFSHVNGIDYFIDISEYQKGLYFLILNNKYIYKVLVVN